MLRRIVTLGLIGLLAAGCSVAGSEDSDTGGAATVTLVTHDSWAAPQPVLDAFRARTGITISVLKNGDAGALTNKLVLTKAAPIGDVAYGVDSTFASRALDAGVFAPYASPAAEQGPQRYAVDTEHRLSAVDVGDVCVNVDTGWFAQRKLTPPSTLDDLADARYRDLLVVQNPATSSPGLAFLLATVAKYGESGWSGYWSRLKANGVQVVSGWTEAYSQQFSGSSGNGPRPVVVSYASSPAAEVGPDGAPRTAAMLDTCYRQVEYAGVLAGSAQSANARKVVDFLLSPEFQATVAENMYVYPARADVALPAAWTRAAPLPTQPASLPGADVQAGRERWIAQWRSLIEG